MAKQKHDSGKKKQVLREKAKKAAAKGKRGGRREKNPKR